MLSICTAQNTIKITVWNEKLNLIVFVIMCRKLCVCVCVEDWSCTAVRGSRRWHYFTVAAILMCFLSPWFFGMAAQSGAWGTLTFPSYRIFNPSLPPGFKFQLLLWTAGVWIYSNPFSIDYTLITNLMHWLLFIHKILFSSTCFEHQVLIFRRT